MSRGYSIDVVQDGDELLQVWEDCELVLPNIQPTIERLESGQFGFLAARIGQRAVGYEMISWIGQNPNEPAFVEVVKHSFPEENRPIPTLYNMNVVKRHRRKSIGRALLNSAEISVVNHETAPKKLVLSVRENNTAARNLYESAGYTVLSLDGQEIFSNLSVDRDEDGEWQQVEVRQVFMAKDLVDIH